MVASIFAGEMGSGMSADPSYLCSVSQKFIYPGTRHGWHGWLGPTGRRGRPQNGPPVAQQALCHAPLTPPAIDPRVWLPGSAWVCAWGMVVARWGWVRVRVHSFTGGHQQGTAARGVGVRRPSRAGSRRRHAHAQGAGAYRILMKLEVDRWALDRRRASRRCAPREGLLCAAAPSVSALPA